MSDQSGIYQRLREIRENRKDSQKKWSEITGIEKGAFNKIELGNRNGTFEDLSRIVESGLLNFEEIIYLVTGKQVSLISEHQKEEYEKIKAEIVEIKKDLEAERVERRKATEALFKLIEKDSQTTSHTSTIESSALERGGKGLRVQPKQADKHPP